MINNSHSIASYHYPAKQRGAVLVVSLMMLIMVTMISLSSMQTSTLEEKMTSNMRDRDIAFQSAEVALREAEDELGSLLPASFNGSGYHYQPSNNRWKTSNIWASNSTATQSITTQINGVAQQPRFYLEQLPSSVSTGGDSLKMKSGGSGNSTNYRATAKGFGGSATAEVVLQTTYRRKN